MKAIKFIAEARKVELPLPPTLTFAEYSDLKNVLDWFRTRERARNRDNFLSAVAEYKEATGDDFCARLDEIIDKQREEVKTAMVKSPYAGRTEASRLESYEEMKEWCATRSTTPPLRKGSPLQEEFKMRSSRSDLITPDRYRERREKIQDFVNEVSEVMRVTPPKVIILDYDTFLQYGHPVVAATYKHDFCLISKEGVRDCIGPAIIINPKIKSTVSLVTHEFIHHRDLEEDMEYTRDLIKKGIDPYLVHSLLEIRTNSKADELVIQENLGELWKKKVEK